LTTISHSTRNGTGLAAEIAAAGAPGHALLAPAFEAFCRLFLTRLGSLTVTFETPLPQGPFMVCANHRSHVDSPVLMAAADVPFAQCGLLAAEDYFFRHPERLRLVSSVLRLIPVERRPTARGFAATLAACSAFLDTGGRMVIAYPEGTRGTTAALRPFKRGPATLAQRYGLPIVPAFIFASERVLPKGRTVPRPSAITVRFGTPLTAEAHVAAGRCEATRLTEYLAGRVRRLGGS
jgi:1-acyl-sn-glycerol-3-phosphate acyltransferase